MKTIRHLNRVRRRIRCCFRIAVGTIARDQLNVGMIMKPALKTGGRTIGQQIHGRPAFEIHEVVP